MKLTNHAALVIVPDGAAVVAAEADIRRLLIQRLARQACSRVNRVRMSTQPLLVLTSLCKMLTP